MRPPGPPPPIDQFAPPPQEQTQEQNKNKKTPYSKPIPKNFQNSWNDIGSGAPPPMPQNMVGGPPGGIPPPGGPMGGPMGGQDGPPPNFRPQGPQGPLPPGCITLQDLQRQATAVVAFGNVYPVLPGANLFLSIMNGEMAVKECLRSEFIMH